MKLIKASIGAMAWLLTGIVLAEIPAPAIPEFTAARSPSLRPAMVATAISEQDDRELRTLRSEAQRERRQQRTLRNQQLTDAARTFRADAGNLEAEYKERVRVIDTEFKLEEVRLQAAQDTRVAALESELQKRFNASVMAMNGQDVAARAQAMEQESKAHQDRLFEVRKEGAATIHAARLHAEARKDAEFLEMDQRALRRAQELGLTVAPESILASPVGGELTRQEQQWNEQEHKEIERITDRHAKLIAGFVTGERLRAWERANLDADFQLAWQERSELHALESQQTFFNIFMMESGGGEEFDQQAFVDRLADNAEQQRLIKIRYEQIRKENVIKRREEKRALAEL